MFGLILLYPGRNGALTRPPGAALRPEFHLPEEDPNVHLERLLTPRELDDSWCKSLCRAIRDVLNPPALPPLEITSKPVDPSELKGLNGLYAGNEVRAGIESLLINLGMIALLLFAGSFQPVEKAMKQAVTLVAPPVPRKPVENRVNAGGGGGGSGARQLLLKKAALPRPARVFVAPRMEPVPAKLPAPVWIEVWTDADLPDSSAADVAGLTGIAALSGSGYGGGIGSGVGSGIGSGSGAGGGVGRGSGSGSGGFAYLAGGGVTNPVPVFSPEADYPKQARDARKQGSVLLSLIVDAAGKAVNIEVLRPLGMGLDEEAVAAVSRWRFIPGKKDGKAVPVRVQVEVTFRLL